MLNWLTSRGAGPMSVGAVLADGATWQVLAQIGARSNGRMP